MRMMMRPTILVIHCMLSSSCMTTGLVGWSNTRDKPLAEHFRVQVALLLILPAIAADVALFPIQMLAKMPPYDEVDWRSSESFNYPQSEEDKRYLRSANGN